MMVLNLLEATERFALIEAELLELSCQPGKDGFLDVRFYPYWEHPTYRSAIESGKQWLVPGREEGARKVRVRVEHLRELRLSERGRIGEWSAPLHHEALFRFEDVGEILMHSELEPRALRKRLRSRHLDFASENVLLACCGYGRDLMPPVSLGELPACLFQPVKEELMEMGLDFEVLKQPSNRGRPEMLAIDEHDYLIADRFQFEVPEFEHRPHWVVFDE